MRRCFIQNADDLSTFVNPMDFSRAPEWLAHVRRRFGLWDVDRYASPPYATCPRFNALLDSVHVEGVNALTQDWRGTSPLVLPNFHELDKILDIVERVAMTRTRLSSCPSGPSEPGGVVCTQLRGSGASRPGNSSAARP